jgi:hypothetical protein
MGAALTYAPPPNLASEASAILRDPLLAELDKLGLKGDLDAWTLQAWPRAITLTPADGDKVRVAFRARLDKWRTQSCANPLPACFPDNREQTGTQKIFCLVLKGPVQIVKQSQSV